MCSVFTKGNINWKTHLNGSVVYLVLICTLVLSLSLLVLQRYSRYARGKWTCYRSPRIRVPQPVRELKDTPYLIRVSKKLIAVALLITQRRILYQTRPYAGDQPLDNLSVTNCRNNYKHVYALDVATVVYTKRDTRDLQCALIGVHISTTCSDDYS